MKRRLGSARLGSAQLEAALAEAGSGVALQWRGVEETRDAG